MIYYHEFTVEGTGSFPTDMLRYDGAYPASPQAVSMISDDWRTAAPLERRSARLIHVGDQRGWEPTVDRWRSFGWTVVSHSYHK